MRKITSRDTEIIRYVEEYGFITIGQAYHIWFHDSNYGYDVARKRLNACVEAGYLKTGRDFYGATTENIYYIDSQYSSISRHMLLIMDTYCKIINFGGDIVHFKREQRWCNGLYRSDAYIVFKFDIFPYVVFVEVLDKGTVSKQKQSTTMEELHRKYNRIINSGEYISIASDTLGVQELDVANLSPVLLIVDEFSEQLDWQQLCQYFKVCHVKFNMANICKILI